EVRAAEVARAGRCPRGGVRQPDALAENLELLARLVQLRGDPGVREQPPEVVARIGEVRRGRRRDKARVDPAEQDPQPGPEDIRDCASRLGATGGGASTTEAHRTASAAANRGAASGASGPSAGTSSRGPLRVAGVQ